MLVELDPSSNKEGNTRAQFTDMHTLKPRHNRMVSFLKTLTPLTFRLVSQKPFMLVELDPSSNKEGNTRAQSTDMHTLKQRHNLVASFLKQIKAKHMTFTTTFHSNSLKILIQNW